MNYELEQKRKLLMESVDKNIKTDDTKTDDTNTEDANTEDANTEDVNNQEEDSVFVTFKNYKTPEVDKKTVNKKSKQATKKLIICDKANRYSYRGSYDKNNDNPNNGEKSVKNISFSEFVKAKQNYKNDVLTNECSASNGFWRFLDVHYVSNELEPSPYESNVKSIVTTSNCAKGYFKLNGKHFDDVDQYHKAVMEELRCTVSCNSSDNSYDVLECDAESTTNEKNLVQDLSNAVIDTSDDDETDPKLEAVASSGDVQTGKRISRKGSVDDSEPQSQGWLW